MIRNRDDEDEKIKTHIMRHPDISFSQLLKQTGLAVSTLRYRLMTLEFENEIICKKRRNQNLYYPKGHAFAMNKDKEERDVVRQHDGKQESANIGENANERGNTRGQSV